MTINNTPLLDLDENMCKVHSPLLNPSNVTIKWNEPILFNPKIEQIIEKDFEYNYKTQQWEEI